LADLLRRVAERGDVEAFRSLFQAYAPRVKSFMMRQGADAGTAEELAQETLLAVWRKARLYSGEKGSASTWIYTIARNLRIDRLRRETPWQELPPGFQETAAACDPLPDEAVSTVEERKRIESAWRGCRPSSTRWSRSPSSRDCRTAKSPSGSPSRWAR
jgi:RNA polymerase sigma-70 factor (ECF subfamily)